MKHLYILFIVFSTTLSHAQVHFKELSHRIMGDAQMYSPLAIAISDVDGDNKDDIIGFNNEFRLTIRYQRGINKAYDMEVVDHDPIENANALLVANVLGDEKVEIIVCSLNEVIVFSSVDGLYSQVAKHQISGLYAQAANVLDYNGDGAREIFICNDIGENILFSLDENGNIIEHDEDFSTLVESDNSGNYGSVWADFDGDNDLDLYIAKCSIYAPDDPTDPRRINQYFQNDDGKLSLVDNPILSDGAQSWSVDAADVNNDGLIDLFYTNHDGAHKLLWNTEIGFEDSGIIFEPSFSYQNIIADFDNDGFQDIFISSKNRGEIYYNRNGAFVRNTIAFSGSTRLSATIGDLNNNGFLDIYGSGGSTSNHIVNRDKILINKGNEHHYVKFHLLNEGSTDIGAKIKVFQSDNIQMREIKSGFSYGITTSTTAHFGLGINTVVEKVEVIWSDGTVEEYQIEKIDTDYVISKGGCVAINQNTIEEIIVCDTATIVSLFTDEHDIIWSNDESKQEIFVSPLDSKGYYFAKSTCGNVIAGYNISFISSYDTPIASKRTYSLCYDEELIIKHENYQVLSLDGIVQGDSIKISEPGKYILGALDICGDVVIDSIEVYQPEIRLDFLDTMYIYDDSLMVLHTSDEVEWYDDLDEAELSTSKTLEYYFTEDTTVIYMLKSELAYTDISTVGLSSDNYTWISDQTTADRLYFDINEPILLESFKVVTSRDAYRKFLLFDGNNDLVIEKVQHLQDGVNEIFIDVFLTEGEDYYITTDAEYNFELTGDKSSYLAYTSDISLPLLYEDIGINIMYSNRGTERYTGFYDWKVRQIKYNCKSEPWALHVIKKHPNAVRDIETNSKIFPNPTFGSFQIISDRKIDRILVRDVSGHLLFTSQSQELHINHPGIYFIEIYNNDYREFRKLVVY